MISWRALSCIAVAMLACACSGGEPSHGDGGDADATDVADTSTQCNPATFGLDAGHADATTDAHTDAIASLDAADVPVLPVQLALGDQFSCARMSDGTVRCWGTDVDGEIADGMTQSRLTPTPIAGVTDAVDIAAGGRHACARLASGAMRCWGRDQEQQIGIGAERVGPVLPTDVPCVTDAAGIGLGGANSCMRTMLGSVQCWGDNASGQIGDGTTTNRGYPTSIPRASGTVQLTAGNIHTCARDSDGTVRCWGDSTFGQAGNGVLGTMVLLPTTVAGVTHATQIVAGGLHTCALIADGSVMCWGRNDSGQLGDESETFADSAVPVTVVGMNSVLKVALGSAHSCSLVAGGSVYCWGWNQSGQLATPTANPEPFPNFVDGVADAVDIAAGGEHTCVIIMGGTVACWGDNAYGQIGDGTRTLRPYPSMVTF